MKKREKVEYSESALSVMAEAAGAMGKGSENSSAKKNEKIRTTVGARTKEKRKSKTINKETKNEIKFESSVADGVKWCDAGVKEYWNLAEQLKLKGGQRKNQVGEAFGEPSATDCVLSQNIFRIPPLRGSLPGFDPDQTVPPLESVSEKSSTHSKLQNRFVLDGIPFKARHAHTLPPSNAALPREKIGGRQDAGLGKLTTDFVSYLLACKEAEGDVLDFVKKHEKDPSKLLRTKRRVYDVTVALNGLGLVTCDQAYSSGKLRKFRVKWNKKEGVSLDQERSNFHIRNDIQNLTAKEKELDVVIQKVEMTLRNLYAHSRNKIKPGPTAAEVASVLKKAATVRETRRSQKKTVVECRSGSMQEQLPVKRQREDEEDKHYLLIHAPVGTVFERDTVPSASSGEAPRHRLIAHNVIDATSRAPSSLKIFCGIFGTKRGKISLLNGGNANSNVQENSLKLREMKSKGRSRKYFDPLENDSLDTPDYVQQSKRRKTSGAGSGNREETMCLPTENSEVATMMTLPPERTLSLRVADEEAPALKLFADDDYEPSSQAFEISQADLPSTQDMVGLPSTQEIMDDHEAGVVASSACNGAEVPSNHNVQLSQEEIDHFSRFSQDSGTLVFSQQTEQMHLPDSQLASQSSVDLSIDMGDT